MWGDRGSRDGSFIRPRAIGVHEGEVHVIDTTGRIQVFDRDGMFVRLWKTPDASNGTPTAIHFTSDGRVLVPDTHYSRVLEYDGAGELTREWGEYGEGETEFIYPTGVVLSANGNYFLSEYGMGAERIHAFDAERQFLRQWGEHGDAPGQFNRAMAIDINDSGILYVADTANHRIQYFDQEGTLLGTFGQVGTSSGNLNFPHDLAVADDGTILVCEYGTHRISRFSGDGTFIACHGSAGRRPGQFAAPRGVASAGDQVFVADTDNHRIQRFGMEALA